jgi:hypothetical protein
MKPWRVCRQAVADTHHFDEVPDPDPHPRSYYSGLYFGQQRYPIPPLPKLMFAFKNSVILNTVVDDKTA